MEIINLILQK